MHTITSRKPADIKPGDRLTPPGNFDGPHSGQVLTSPVTEGLTVRVQINCDRCRLEHSVSMQANRVVTVERDRA